MRCVLPKLKPDVVLLDMVLPEIALDRPHAADVLLPIINLTGNADPAGLPSWPTYSVNEDFLINFGADGPKVEADPWKSRLDLVEALQK